MKFYVSTDPAAGDREVEECPECAALIAPGAYLKHRTRHEEGIGREETVELIDERIGEHREETPSFDDVREIAEKKIDEALGQHLEDSHRGRA